MAFLSGLPTGSLPFTSQLYRDPNERVWAGNEFDGRFYRFFDPADTPYINIKDFGAIGDGVTDDTSAFYEAVSFAKVNEASLYVPPGRYPVNVTANSVNMNGCTGITGEGELVFTSTGNPDVPLLLWSGTKTLIASAVPVSGGQTAFTVGVGLSIGKGDTIFVASNENIYGDLDASSGNYKKGGRFTVDTYDSGSGALVCYEPSYYGITSAYIYHNNNKPKVYLKDATISIIGNQDKKGIEIRVGELFIDSIKAIGFGRFGVNSSSSLCRITRSQIFAESIPGTTTGYCLQSSGLSDVIFSDSLFYGNRHGVACGDSGYWRTTDVGEGTSNAIALPSVVRGAGSRIEGSSYALDSHAGTTLLDVFNCDIYGGVIGGALETYVSGCRIHQGESPMAFRMGRDRNLNSRIFHNSFKVSNCDIFATTQAFGIFADLERVELSNVSVHVTPDGARDMIGYNSGSVVRKWVIDGIKHYGNAGDGSSNYFFRMINGASIHNCDLNMARVSIEMRSVPGRTINHVKLINSTIKSSTASAFDFDYFDLNKVVDLSIVGSTIDGGTFGVRARGARTISISSSNLSRQSSNAVMLRSSAGNDVPLSMVGNTLIHSTGDVINVQSGQEMPTTLVGNIFANSSSIASTVNIVGKYGNIGLDDKLKTGLTSTTSAKYGAASGSGDLTLS